MDSTQQRLDGQTIRLEKPNLSDRFHKCQKQCYDEQIKRKKVCGNDPYLTVVGYDGSRKPLCKMHAREAHKNEFDA